MRRIRAAWAARTFASFVAIVIVETSYATSAVCIDHCVNRTAMDFAIMISVLAIVFQFPLIAIGKLIHNRLREKQSHIDVLMWAAIYWLSSKSIVMNSFVWVDDLCCYQYDLSNSALERASDTHVFATHTSLLFIGSMIAIAYVEKLRLPKRGTAA